VPAVSVCIPTYNSARFLGETIESVLAQEFTDFELVVVDNASTDGTPELCARYTDPRLRYIRFEELVGQAANWNRCLELALAPYVMLLHGDDLLAPTHLARAVPVLDRHPDVGMLFCCAQHIDAAGGPMHLQRAYPDDQVVPGDAFARRLMLEGCLVNPAGVLVRQTAFAAAGRFTEQVVWGVDWHMWIRLALHAPVAYLAEPLSRYRQHGQSGTTGVMSTARNGRDEQWMFDDIFAHLPAAHTALHSLRPAVRRGIAHRTWCFAEEMCLTGFPAAARAQLRAATRAYPGIAAQPRYWVLWLATYLGYGWFQKVQSLRGSQQAA
jgi:glycosyltransferase involved in cell wall biosynthesis